MKDIYLISDTHFQHHNIVHKFDPPRPFHTVNEMDDQIIERWNSVVKPGDKVYHLGDVFFGNKETFKSLWPRLNGRKRLVVGNHDDVKFLSSGNFFEKVMLWRKFKEFGLVLTHTPLHSSTLKEGRFGGEEINVHGHTHFNGSPKGPYVSVCCEMIDYTPVHIEEVRNLWKKQQTYINGS